MCNWSIVCNQLIPHLCLGSVAMWHCRFVLNQSPMQPNGFSLNRSYFVTPCWLNTIGEPQESCPACPCHTAATSTCGVSICNSVAIFKGCKWWPGAWSSSPLPSHWSSCQNLGLFPPRARLSPSKKRLLWAIASLRMLSTGHFADGCTKHRSRVAYIQILSVDWPVYLSIAVTHLRPDIHLSWVREGGRVGGSAKQCHILAMVLTVTQTHSLCARALPNLVSLALMKVCIWFNFSTRSCLWPE